MICEDILARILILDASESNISREVLYTWVSTSPPEAEQNINIEQKKKYWCEGRAEHQQRAEEVVLVSIGSGCIAGWVHLDLRTVAV